MDRLLVLFFVGVFTFLYLSLNASDDVNLVRSAGAEAKFGLFQ